MAPPTFSPHAKIVEHRKPDVIVNSRYFEDVKCFIAQTIVFIEKLFSHKKSIAMRTSKLDLMLTCFDHFFGEKLL